MGTTLFIKRTICHACGGPKVTRSKTAYVYCDYCATLTDWDFQVAVSTASSAMPGPAYEALSARMKSTMDQALNGGNREQYAAAQRELYTKYVELCPGSLSPRVGDPHYRHAYIEYTVASAVANDFDPIYKHHTAAMNASIPRLVWSMEVPTKPKVRGDTFWSMFEAVRGRTARATELNVSLGLLSQHPDGVHADLVSRMAMSVLAQGWLPMLEVADAERLLHVTGLKGDYVEAPEPELVMTTCAGCHGSLPIAKGARRVLCEHCGHVNIQGATHVACPGCGAGIDLAAGQRATQCPFCHVDLRAMRWM